MASRPLRRVKKPTDRKLVQSVDRSLELLDILSSGDLGFSLAELSERSGLHASTAHRLLATLMARGYVRQISGTRVYRLGYGAIDLAKAAESQVHLVAELEGDLKGLAQDTHELVNLAVPDWPNVIYVAQFNGRPTDSVQIFTRLGARVPLYCSGVGKAMLAQLSDREIAAYLSEERLKAFTRFTITKPKELRRELATIRELGYALDNEERAIGVRCAASAIKDHDGNPIAAVSVSGLSGHLTPDRLHILAGRVARFADALSKRLGYTCLDANGLEQEHAHR